jgi:hypothetical protein
MAAENGSVEVVHALLEHGANVGTEDEEGWTPLHEAIRNGSVELLRVILEHGADINARTNDTRTPLLVAATNGNVYVMRVLLEHGANVEADGGQERENLIPDCVGEGIQRYCGTTVKSRYKGRVLCEHQSMFALVNKNHVRTSGTWCQVSIASCKNLLTHAHT